ncbi:hypothetical protein CASFOL_034220 [Castilleja foliolosa]|uniref:CDC20/Fizzy WD40 domain-containing protein n=1 Tax=Castilleja foliolosa TaxID=1961234 RepID=A0ABD3BXS2_9LAMI
MDDCDLRLQSDWYSPTRLHDSPVKYDFPGDRFIPNRSLMDLDQAHTVLTNRTCQGPCKIKSQIGQKLENLTLDAEGRPFQMLVFRGSPKSSRKSSHLIDEMRRSDEAILTIKPPLLRRFPKKEARIMDAPNYKCDFYVNLMDWGKTNILAVALGAKLHLWNAGNLQIELLSEGEGNDYPTSVSWSEDARILSAGYNQSKIQLYDAEHLKPDVRLLEGHRKRVGAISWNGHLLTTGSTDRAIINHDVRARNSVVSRIEAHTSKVCGLKWSSTGKLLASGGNDNRVYLWDVRKMDSKQHMYRFSDHRAAVKALAWSPYDENVLASGGGTDDGSIKIWNTQKGTCISSTNTNAQITGLEWNVHHKEILSGHGYSVESNSNNRLCLWRYPSMSRIGESATFGSRVLALSQSPDGLTVISAIEDETLRLWEVFGPASDKNSKVSYLGSLLSLKTSPLR